MRRFTLEYYILCIGMMAESASPVASEKDEFYSNISPNPRVLSLPFGPAEAVSSFCYYNQEPFSMSYTKLFYAHFLDCLKLLLPFYCLAYYFVIRKLMWFATEIVSIITNTNMLFFIESICPVSPRVLTY